MPRREGKPRIAGVVVLYRPGEEVAANITTYLEQVDILFAVDNSEDGSGQLALLGGELAGIVFVANGENLGVAAALNIGVRLALDEGCDFLLTMDQDSRATPGMVRTMLDCLDSFDHDEIGIVAPFLVTRPGERPVGNADCLEVETAMTSGSILDLRAYQKAGPFLEELFVDFVDIEYSLRIRAGGFRIVRANRAVLEHCVGDLMKIPMVGGDLYLTSHAPQRKYYKTRNRFYVAGRYRSLFPAFCRRDRIRFFLELIRLLLFEGDKKEKLAMMARGYSDYRNGRMGRYDPEGGASP
jgi:rhamnosyltransferase